MNRTSKIVRIAESEITSEKLSLKSFFENAELIIKVGLSLSKNIVLFDSPKAL